jgi:hypothetical protein
MSLIAYRLGLNSTHRELQVDRSFQHLHPWRYALGWHLDPRKWGRRRDVIKWCSRKLRLLPQHNRFREGFKGGKRFI